jgi:hypothetical protein
MFCFVLLELLIEQKIELKNEMLKKKKSTETKNVKLKKLQKQISWETVHLVVGTKKVRRPKCLLVLISFLQMTFSSSFL